MARSSRYNRMTWEELVEELTRHVHSALLTGGGNHMRSAMHIAMERAIRWNEEQDEKRNA